MTADLFPSRIATLVGGLKAKTKPPISAGVLSKWITLAEDQIGPEGKAGRLSHLAAHPSRDIPR